MMTKQPSKFPNKNYYKILDLEPGCSHNDIVHAYNRSKEAYSAGSLASYSMLDPEENKAILMEVEDAFAVLGNPAKRREYDLALGFSTWVGGTSSEERVPVQSTQLKAEWTTQDDQEQKPFGAFPENDFNFPGEETQSSFQVIDGGEDTVVSEPKVVSQKPLPEPLSNPAFEKEIANCKELTGEFLRAVRLHRQMTVEQVAKACKLSPRIIERLEAEEIESLNYQPVYLRGHVHMMCQVLDIPAAADLAKSYVERMKAQNKVATSSF